MFVFTYFCIEKVEMVIMLVTSIKDGLQRIKWYKREEFSLFNIYCHSFMIIQCYDIEDDISWQKNPLLTAFYREGNI